MGDKSKIEWTNASWNPVTGCDKVSTGCLHCYAEVMAKRLQAMGQENYSQGFRVSLHPEMLTHPLVWSKPRRIFVNSMSDLFHKDIPFEFLDRVFAVMALCPQHTFQILTKRPEQAVEYFATFDDPEGNLSDTSGGFRLGCAASDMLDGDWIWGPGKSHRKKIERFICDTHGESDDDYEDQPVPWPLPNVQIGTSIENQAMANRRIPELRKIPATVRFLSCEPLLGPIDLSDHWGWYPDPYTVFSPCDSDPVCGGPGICGRCTGRWQAAKETAERCALPEIHWVIAGGESGPDARPMHPDWARSLRDQAAAARVPFLFKQWGEWHPEASSNWATGKGTYRYGKVEGLAMLRDGRISQRNTANDPAGRGILVDQSAYDAVTNESRHERDFCETLGYQWMQRIGKSAAGCLLDGREWKEFPN